MNPLKSFGFIPRFFSLASFDFDAVVLPPVEPLFELFSLDVFALFILTDTDPDFFSSFAVSLSAIVPDTFIFTVPEFPAVQFTVKLLFPIHS